MIELLRIEVWERPDLGDLRTCRRNTACPHIESEMGGRCGLRKEKRDLQDRRGIHEELETGEGGKQVRVP